MTIIEEKMMLQSMKFCPFYKETLRVPLAQLARLCTVTVLFNVGTQ